MPLYKRKSTKCVTSTQNEYGSLETSTLSQESLSPVKNNKFAQKRNMSFKVPEIIGLKKTVLDYLSSSGSVSDMAELPQSQENALPKESASFERGHDRDDAEFLHEINSVQDNLGGLTEIVSQTSTENVKKMTNAQVASDVIKIKRRLEKVTKKRAKSEDKENNVIEDEDECVSKKNNKVAKSDPIKKNNKKQEKKDNQIVELNESTSTTSSWSESKREAFKKYMREKFEESLSSSIAELHNESKSESQNFGSPPRENMERFERLKLYQEERNVGLYVHCDAKDCNKLRYLPKCKDPLELPDKWYCDMNTDSRYNSCDKPEEPISPAARSQFINDAYNAGSVVWARVEGHPWWPAMVDHCPDLEEYLWLDETQTMAVSYSVTFFDSADVTRVWLKKAQVMPYVRNVGNSVVEKLTRYHKRLYGKRLAAANKQALEALKLPLLQRLRTFSFIARYTRKILAKPKEKSIKPKKTALKRKTADKIAKKDLKKNEFVLKGRKVDEKNKKGKLTNIKKDRKLSRKILNDDELNESVEGEKVIVKGNKKGEKAKPKSKVNNKQVVITKKVKFDENNFVKDVNLNDTVKNEMSDDSSDKSSIVEDLFHNCISPISSYSRINNINLASPDLFE